MSDPKASDETSDQTTDQHTGNNDPQESAEESVEEIEAARKERLAPENRPENAEVDNTDRTFDEETGYFTDSEEHDSAEKRFVNEDPGASGSGDSGDSGDTDKQDSADDPEE